MPNTPNPFFLGQMVLLPAVSGGNGGVDRHPGVITQLVDLEPEGGGVVVNVRTFTNAVGLSLGVVQVLFCAYESEAFAQGFGGLLNNVPQGCWPLDN